MASPQTLTK